MAKPRPAKKLKFEVRSSRIVCKGGFATERIRKGTRIIEYLGERITHKESDRRYPEDDPSEIVLLFVVDRGIVIDAAVGGNKARFINHSCDPNCETVIEDRRVFIESIRTITPGEELTYDYSLTREDEDSVQEELDYACHCGSANCRGTMLEERPKRRKRKKK